MNSQYLAAQLAAEAYDLWQQDRYEEAEAKYREAVRLAPADAPALADYYGEFAAVLEGLGKFAEAQSQLETSLALELGRAADDTEIGVVIARYFLAEFFLRHQQPQRALDAVVSFIPTCREGLWLLHLVEAEALAAVGEREAAEHAARRCLRAAPAEDQRSELRLRFLAIGLHDAVM
jgi:tetratricopeptide (TPR) repeat protein